MRAIDSNSLSTVLMAVRTYGIGGPVLGLVGLLERSARPGRRWPRAGSILSGLLALVASALAVAGQPVMIWLAVAALAAVDLLSRGLHRGANVVGNFGRAAIGARRLHAALLLAGAPVIAFALGHHINSLTEAPDLQLSQEQEQPLSTTRPTNRQMVTDRGRLVPLYEAISTFDDPANGELKRHEERLPRNSAGHLPGTGDPDVATNCHGWIFLGSGFCLLGEDIPKILEDNGYEKVSRPRPGDLVIYHDAQAKVLHSGLVRFVDDRMALVESKWGTLGRYLHAPENQPYSQEWTYYPTLRLNHLLYADRQSPPFSVKSLAAASEVR